MNFNNFIKTFIDFHNNNKDINEPLFKVIADINNSNKQHGLCLEFGVWNGLTISYINEKLPNWNIYGFDSFEGLPESWNRSDDSRYIKGYFSLNGQPPILHNNINIVKGWFDITLPDWISCSKHNQVDLLHIDCDIYSSTKCVLDNCVSLIKKDTIIVFDELISYCDFEQHEIKALYEFIKKTNLNFKILYSGGWNLEKVAIIIQ